MNIIPVEIVEKRIYLLRGKKVMLDRDLAELYGVETRVLNQAVRRNSKRFPDDFMFILTREEIMRLSQIVITSSFKFSPNVQAFTEQGIAMLSGILNSDRAVQVNIQIMRTFIRLREMLMSNKELKEKIEAMEKKYDHQFRIVFDAIKQLIDPEPKVKKKRYGLLAERNTY